MCTQPKENGCAPIGGAYQNWRDGEPNSWQGHNEDVGVMYDGEMCAESGDKGLWNDGNDQCSQCTRQYVCSYVHGQPGVCSTVPTREPTAATPRPSVASTPTARPTSKWETEEPTTAPPTPSPAAEPTPATKKAPKKAAPSKTKLPLGAIVGAAAGVLALGGAAWWCRRRHKARMPQHAAGGGPTASVELSAMAAEVSRASAAEDYKPPVTDGGYVPPATPGGGGGGGGTPTAGFVKMDDKNPVTPAAPTAAADVGSGSGMFGGMTVHSSARKEDATTLAVQ